MQGTANGAEQEVQEIPSVCAGENPDDAFCAMCGDKFEQFFNDEMEEWHLRGAVRAYGKTFHALCCEDYKVSIFVMMLRLLLETLCCHFDKKLVCTPWLHGALRILTTSVT
jgi:hypothetical protein